MTFIFKDSYQTLHSVSDNQKKFVTVRLIPSVSELWKNIFITSKNIWFYIMLKAQEFIKSDPKLQ